MTSAKLSPPTIFVGLGNPGEKYLKTRHNIGYWFLGLLADHHNASPFKSESKLLGSAAKVSLAERKLLLVRPSTFMNESGESIRRFLNYYKFDLSNLCVIHDDLDLKYGSSKIKFDGGHGGHNGLRNIIDLCGSSFLRVRIGIGHPERQDAIDYVLSKPTQQEAKNINSALNTAIESVDIMLNQGVAKAMDFLNQSNS